MAGESRSNPRICSRLDHEYLVAAVTASYAGLYGGEPPADVLNYWVGKAAEPDLYSDDVWRVGWNRYLEDRMSPGNTGSSNPAYGDMEPIFKPYQTHEDAPHADTPNHEDVPQAPLPEFQEDVLTLLHSINDRLGELLQVTREQKADVVQALKDAAAAIPKIKLF